MVHIGKEDKPLIHQSLKEYKVPGFHNAQHKKHYEHLLNRIENMENITYSIDDFDSLFQLSGLYVQRDIFLKSIAAEPLIRNENSRGAVTTSANPNVNALDRVETNIRHLLKELLLTQLTRHNRIEGASDVNPLDELFGNV